MARSVAKLKMGYYPLPESEGVKLRELLTFTGPASVVDPCMGQGTALNLLTQGADVRRYPQFRPGSAASMRAPSRMQTLAA